jgi:hypothetical protein
VFAICDFRFSVLFGCSGLEKKGKVEKKKIQEVALWAIGFRLRFKKRNFLFACFWLNKKFK